MMQCGWIGSIHRHVIISIEVDGDHSYSPKIKVETAGRIEICSPELGQGMEAEVIVLLNDKIASKAALSGQTEDLLRRTQTLPQIQTITEEEIAAEIAAYRAEQRENSD